MKNIIPYEHDIKFDNKIAEITSISLEYNDSIDNDGISGEFIVSGEYKSHVISVNKESFAYNIPFSIDLPDRVIKESINYDVSDFTYDIKDDNTLTVKIELELSYDENGDKEDIIDILEERNVSVPIESEIEVENDSNNIIMDNVISNVDTYITYHVYNVKKNDNIEDIAKSYNSTKDLIMEYNNIDELKDGIKIIIPEIDNE